MKKYLTSIKTAGIGVLIAMSLVFTGCDSWIDPSLNENPDAPIVVPMKLILPSLQTSLAYDFGGNTAVRTTNIWLQYFDGVERQSYAEGIYTLTPSDVNNLWNSLYASEMMDAHTLILKAEDEGGVYFGGVAKVLMASALGLTTDLWGDIPYTQAFKGAESVEGLSPEFDTQENIYTSIFALLDEAIADFESSENLIALSGDMIYNNDITLWKKAAYSLKARYKLNLALRNGNAAYSDALALVANGFESSADNMDFGFGTSSAEASPFFQFMEQRSDIRMSSTFVNALIADNDPRLPFYVSADGGGNYVGSDPGSQNTLASNPGDFIAGMSSATVFMSYAELKFIEAETEYRVGSPANALAAYKAAVAASLDQVTNGADNTAWLDANINVETTATLTLDKILYQKRMAMFGTAQAFSDWRRTGYPALSPVIGATSNELPRRFPYAQEEQTYNANCPTGVTIEDRVWWDVE